RRRPGDLRLARCGRTPHALVPAGLPRHHARETGAELPLDPGDPRRRQRRDRRARTAPRQDAVHRQAGARAGHPAGRRRRARRRRIGDASFAQHLKAAAQWGGGQPLLAAARAADRIPDLRPNVREAFAGLGRLVDGLRERHAQADPATVLEQIVAAVGYVRYLAEEGPEGVERVENVEELIAGAAEWAETAGEDGD